MKPRIMFLDDEQSVLDSLRRILRMRRNDWDMTFLTRPIQALEMLKSESFDTLVCDLRMPELTGLELLDRLQDDPKTNQVPVVVLTGEADRSLKRVALQRGATDLLNKPVDCEDLVARLNSVLRLKMYEDQLRTQNERLEELVQERTRELESSRLEILWRLAKAAEYRDEDTGNHVIRVACYSRVVAQQLGASRQFADTLFLAAPLHDVGKIAIPDDILRKPGRLTPDEWDVMRTHAELGAEILGGDTQLLHLVHQTSFAPADHMLMQGDNPILAMARTIAQTHHEKWDGSGYPEGLCGEEIPLAARIVAIADVYDALRSDRPYKQGYSEEVALDILHEGAGAHFDPAVHAAFVNGIDSIRSVQATYSYSDDTESETAVAGA